MRLILLITIFCTSLVFNSYSQRIKYKNVFPLLQSKDYKSAEPLLLQFLKENDDEANAYFYLGEIIISKLDTVEIFPTTEKYDSMANLAISSYKKAISLVDDREVRKNDDYYIAYNRRDLRTGKFGIKTSDVTLDYENKISTVTSRKELIHEIHELNEKAINQYGNFKNKAIGFYSSYPDESSFMLRANSDDREALSRVKELFSTFSQEYSAFVKKLERLGHPLYNPELKLITINSWSDLAPKEIDFSDFKVEVQDYDTYLSQVDNKIESEVQPTKELLFQTDEDFNSALRFNENVKDSAQIKELIVPDKLIEGLRDLDQKNVILNLFQYKQLKNKSNLMTNVNLFPVLADSSNIYQRTNVIKKYKNRLGDQLELIKVIEGQLDDRIKLDFATYFDSFEPSVDAYISTERTILAKKYDDVTNRSEEMERDIQYFTVEQDSVYITPLGAAANNSEKYILDIIESDSCLLMVGSWQEIPFVANAGFDMKIKHKIMIEDTSLVVKKILDLKDKVLVNLKSREEGDQSQLLLYLSYQMEELWRLEFDSESTLADAKVEAGIFFLYDEAGKVLKTLNAQGEVIGK